MAKNLQATTPTVPDSPLGDAVPVTLSAPADSPMSVVYEFSPMFLLMAAPRRYQTDGDGAVVLNLSKLLIEPGINGVDSFGNYNVAVAAAQSRGEVVIPIAAARAEDTPDGHPGYLRETPTKRGPYYHTAWERLEVHAGIGVVVPVDRAGYRRWLGALVERGVVPPIHASVLRHLRDRTEDTLQAASDRPGAGGQRAVALAKVQLAALDKRVEGAA